LLKPIGQELEPRVGVVSEERFGLPNVPIGNLAVSFGLSLALRFLKVIEVT
jgi:hypothetical protein